MRYLITGAASGIGRAVATMAAGRSDQAELTLVDTNADALASAAHDVESIGAKVETLVADLGDPSTPERVVGAAVSRFGGLDALISNAGMMAGGNLEALELEAYDRTFAVNTRATWLLAKSAFEELKRSRGSLVATVSISGTNPTPPAGAYSASKAALRMLVQQLALEWGKYGIRANCVSPGPTDTGLTRSSFGLGASGEAERNRAYREAVSPLRRIGRPEDVAAAILFLASEAAAQISGVDLPVDGALSLAVMPVTGRAPGFRLDELDLEGASK